MSCSVLLLEGQTIQSLPCLSSLKKKGYETHIFCKNKSYGWYSRFTDKHTITVDCQKNPVQYRQGLMAYLRKNKIDVVIPMNDEVSPFVSQYKEEINQLSNVLIPEIDIFMKGYDKNLLMKICKEIGAAHPATADLDEVSIEEAAEIVRFPAIIKPNHTSGGRGMRLVRSFKELKDTVPLVTREFGSSHLQTYVPETGRQFKVQIFTDNNLIHMATVMEKKRFYPVNGGSSCCNVTVENPDIVNQCTKVLKHIGWVGFADFDLIEDPRDRVFKIMEINPRIPACIRTSFVSGVDFVEIICDYTLTNKIKDYVYAPGKTLRYFGLDLLWLLNSQKRFSEKIDWFKIFGKEVYYQDGSFTDPVPFLIGTLENIKKLFNPEFKKAKKGLG